MSTINEKTAEVLNDLIQINNDRITGYERAAKETAAEDADLRALFLDMTTESRRYVSDLTQYVFAVVWGNSCTAMMSVKQ